MKVKGTKHCFPASVSVGSPVFPGLPCNLDDVTNHNRAAISEKRHTWNPMGLQGTPAPQETCRLGAARQADSTCPSDTNTMSHHWPQISGPQRLYQKVPAQKRSAGKGLGHMAVSGPPRVGRVCRAATETHLLLMVSMTPRRMMMNMRRPATTPAIFTVLSTCFSGSTLLGFCVEAPWRERGRRKITEKPHIRDETQS